MRRQIRSNFGWKHLPTAGFLLLAIWLLFQFDPIFQQSTTILLLLLPLAWGSISTTIPSFQSDFNVFTPKNIMLFIWFNKLVIVPLELIFVGNKAFLLNPKNQPINTEVSIIILSCFAFVAGWQYNVLKSHNRVFAPLHSTKQWAIIYLSISLLSLLILYGSLAAYWAGSIFTYVTRQVLEQVSGTFTGFFANVGQRFWPFGIILAWYWWKQKYPHLHQWYWSLLWLLLCLVGTLSSNRSNMLYPALTFGSIIAAGWQLRQKSWLLILSLGLVLLSLFFGYLRVQPTLDTERVGELFDAYLSDNDYIWYAHQLYFGTPYQITPLLGIENQSFTLLASTLDPVPILGKAFREQSGPFVYNLAIYDSTVSQDKVIPVAGELYYNGGFTMLTAGYFLFGVVYRWLDTTFKYYVVANPPLAASFFYLALLFNATLLLSLSVLVQFALYNAPPALLIIVLNWWQMRKAS